VRFSRVLASNVLEVAFLCWLLALVNYRRTNARTRPTKRKKQAGGGTDIVICKKCPKVALPKNYGFCHDHRTSRAAKEEEEQELAEAEEADGCISRYPAAECRSK
jgi:hypothetical protein